MTIHPSQFPKRADGTRFCMMFYGAYYRVFASDTTPICACDTPETAEMVAAALEFQVRDGETFPLEEKPCKPT